MRDATRNLATATKTRKSFATSFGNKLDPLHSWRDARLTTLLWNQRDASWASCRNQQNSNVSTNCYGIRWVLLLWQCACGLRSPIFPSRESLVQCDPILSWSFGTMHHEWTDRECSRTLVSYISFGADSQCGIIDHLLYFRTCDRVVDLSWCESSE